MPEFLKSGTVDFTGGLNTRTDEANLTGSQFSEFRNITLYKKTLKKRLGSSRQTRITKQRSDQFTGTQYIRIPHHADYNIYHVYSAQESLSIYFEIQCRFSYSASNIIPIIYKKNSFFLYIHTDNSVRLYWKDRGVNTLITSPYLLSNLAPLSSQSGFVNLGVEFTNTAGDNIKLYWNGMKITDHDENGPGTLNTNCWDDFNSVAAGNIYLGYYDGVDYSAVGGQFAAEKFFTGDMWEFRVWRTDSNINYDPALSDNNKKRYCFGGLPASIVTDASLKGYFRLGDDSTSVVQDSDANNNDGFWVGPANSRSPKYQGNMNARGVFQFRRQTGSDIDLIDGGQTIYQDMGTEEWLPIWRRDPDRISTDDSITVSYTYLPETTIYNDRMYFATGEEKPFKHNGTFCDLMGIVKPAGAPTLNAATAGILNATYSWRYTYYNSTQGIESNPSDAYTASPANQQLDLNLDRPKDRQVDKIRVYRTKAGGSVLYFLKEIDAFVSYTYNSAEIIWSDNFLDSVLTTSSVMPTLNNTPPQCKYISEHHDRIFLAGDPAATSTLYYSESALPESFPSANAIDIGTTFEGDITGINYSRGRLYIFKERAIWYLYGTTPEDFFTDYISREVGCTVPRSRMLINDMIFFASSDGIYVLEGSSGKIQPISEQIKPTYLDGLDHSTNSKWQAVHNKKFNQYILFCTSSGSSVNDIALVYDYNSNAWSIWDMYADAAGEFFESQQDEVYTVNDAAGSTEIVLFKQNSSNADGVSINSPFRQPTNFGTTWIEDDGKIFAWTDSAFIGCPIYLIDYTTGTVQKRIITANTTSRITVNSAFSPALSAVYSYAIGGIYMHAETGWMDIGEPQRLKRYQSVDLLFNPVTAVTALVGSRSVRTSPLELPQVASSIDYEATFSKYRHFDLTESDGHVRWSISRRGRNLKIRIFSPAPNTPVEIIKIIFANEIKSIR